MNQRHTLAVTAGAATLLAAFPMSTIFQSFTWFFYAAMAIIVVAGTGIGVRALRGPVWAQVIAMLGGLLLFSTLVFPSGGELIGVIPSGATFAHFNDLLVAAGGQIRNQAPPVPDLEGLLLLTTVGIGLVAILVDLAAVGLRRPALAGLPMLALYSVPVAVIPDSLSFLPFVFAAAGFIWLLVSDSVDRVRRFGRRFTGEGRDVDVWEASPLSSAGRRLGVVGVIVAILIPLAVPGMTSGLIETFGSGDGPGSGGVTSNSGGTTVDLNGFLEGQLNRTETADMVRVTTNDPAPFYLRLAVADEVTPKGFANRAASGNPLSELAGDYTVPQVSGASSQRFHAEIQITNLNMNLAPIYEQLVGTQGLGDAWFHEPSTGQVFSRRESTAGRKYGVDYVRPTFSPSALRTAGPIAGNDPVRQLTVVPSIQYVTELVDRLTAGLTNQYDRVHAIHDFFIAADSGFTYTLSTVPGNTNIPIVDFLTAKRGFCVQYATAMAWLVRAAGIPARVAFGFTRGRAASGGGYLMTNHNLHAWTEVYFPSFGWVPFDSTPPGSVEGMVQQVPPTPQPTGSEGPDVANPSAEPSASNSAGAGGAVDDPGAGPPLINTWWLVAAAVVALIVAMLFVPSTRRRSLRRQRRTTGGELITLGDEKRPRTDLPVSDPIAIDAARRDAHAAWAELKDLMIDYRVIVDDAETPRATGERLNALLAPPAIVEPADLMSSEPGRRRGPRHAAPVADQLALLARAEERARYARHPLHPHGLDAAVAAAGDALASRATRGQRIGARLMPRSVLLRWRAAWLGAVARGSNRLTKIREAMSVVNPRRLLARPTR